MEQFRASTALDPLGGEVRSIDVVRVSRQGSVGAGAEAGIRLMWTQGGQAYGLLMPVSRLVEQVGHLDSVALYLRLAVDEPHGPTPDGTVLWFEDLPSAPY